MIGRSSTVTPWRVATFGLPLATILIATLMMPLPFAIKLGGYWLMPSLPIITIFLWTISRPDLLPPIALLIAGALLDLLINAPLGASSLAFLTVYVIVASQRLYWMTLDGSGMILCFASVALVCGIIVWLATSFAHGQWLNPMPAVLELVMSVIAFPLVRWFIAPLQRLAGPAV